MLESKKFTKMKEDFTCENCSFEVDGTGYTNHCSRCLWSKHVDINPGDRLETCGGMMEPVAVEAKSDGYVITHKCIKCDHKKRNKASKLDDFPTILKISAKY